MTASPTKNLDPFDRFALNQPDLQADHSLVHPGWPLHAVVGSHTTPGAKITDQEYVWPLILIL